MLPADQRLRRADDFAAVIRRGRRAARDGLVVHVLPPVEAEASAPSRAGFVVPKAVGTAVTRNTVRRRLRHLMRAELARLGPGTDVVVRVLPAAAGRPSAGLGRDLGAAIASARTKEGRSGRD